MKTLIDGTFGAVEYVQLTDNVVSFNPVEDSEDNPETVMTELRKQLIEKVMDVAAAACFGSVILDLRDNVATDRLGRLLAPVIELCASLRIEMKVVGDDKIGQALQATLEGDVVTVVADLAQAKSA